MQLSELFSYKNELMKELCSTPEIVKLVTDNASAAVPNYELPYSRVFPYEFVPETVSDGTTFICFDVDVPTVENKTYLSPILYVWVFTHKSKLRLSDGGVRTDQLAIEINKKLNGSRLFGLGELELKSTSRFVPILDYQGRVLVFAAADWNRPGISKSAPSKRG